jgi:hypothetical protein
VPSVVVPQDLGLLVDEPHTLALHVLNGGGQVIRSDVDLVDSFATLGEEPSDRTIAGRVIDHGDMEVADPNSAHVEAETLLREVLDLVGLAVQGPGNAVLRRIDVFDGDRHFVNAEFQRHVALHSEGGGEGLILRWNASITGLSANVKRVTSLFYSATVILGQSECGGGGWL